MLHANYTNCKQIVVATNQSVHKNLHPNTLSRALGGLCTVSVRYLIEGSLDKPILIIRCLDFRRKVCFFENPLPKF